ncbi:hypothetical protein MBLNU457_1898t1 [Dothideomycetes sp. NU457]
MSRLLPKFTVTPLQATTYLLGVALFSISFLVFLNSSISFVVTDVIGQEHGIGDAVGTLGFADELLALVACPLWGLVSDRVGVRPVAVTGYIIIGISLICLVQSKRVYPDLLIFRLLFSLGGAACSTMVTAILPTMTVPRGQEKTEQTVTDLREDENVETQSRRTPGVQTEASSNRNSMAFSINSELTITPARFEDRAQSNPGATGSRRQRNARPQPLGKGDKDPKSDTSRLAGIVGMFTGIGALLAVVVFLPLPAALGRNGPKAQAVQESFYIVGITAMIVGLFVLLGLRDLPGEEHKNLSSLFRYNQATNSKTDSTGNTTTAPSSSYIRLFGSALLLGITDSHITLGYLGGFVARASSVGISAFIPLFVNAYYIRTGKCNTNPDDTLSTLENRHGICNKAYTTAAMLTGISQLVALLSAPLFGYFNASLSHRRFLSNAPLALGAIAGIVGFTLFGLLQSPDPREPGGKASLLAVILLGISQIGAIVCSLGSLSQGIQQSAPVREATTPTQIQSTGLTIQPSETAPLLPASNALPSDTAARDRTHLKGSIAGVYSLCGGAGILVLSKVGGVLFDRTILGTPFFMLAGFNGLLLVGVVGVTLGREVKKTVDEGYEVGDEEDGEERLPDSVGDGQRDA